MYYYNNKKTTTGGDLGRLLNGPPFLVKDKFKRSCQWMVCDGGVGTISRYIARRSGSVVSAGSDKAEPSPLISWVATRAALARSVIGTCKALGAVAIVGVDVRVVVGCIIVLM